MTRIEIVESDPTWPEQFVTLRTRLASALGDEALRIDHIGSTSVPGLAAKDVIDIQITVAALDPAILDQLETAGFTARRDITDDVLVGCDDRVQLTKLYAREGEGERRANIHIRAAGRRNQRYALLFRDYLRADPTVRDAYAQLKRHLAVQHPDDVDAYYDVKDPVMDIIYRGAEVWAAAHRWSQ
ncbi:MAG: GrpB family protein [Actinomycetota bacterium]